MNKNFNLTPDWKNDIAKKIFITIWMIPFSLGSTMSFAEPGYTDPESVHGNSTNVAYSPVQSLANLNTATSSDGSIVQKEYEDRFSATKGFSRNLLKSKTTELDANGFEGSGITESEFSDESEAESLKKSMMKLASRAKVKSIIGLDQRIFVPDTTVYPFRVMTQILFISGNGVARCSGVLIGKDTVLTAGHCLYQEGIWSTNVEVHPGSNGSESPYGVCSAKSLYVAPEWLDTEDFRYDYGVVKLDCDIGLRTGWLGWHVQTGNIDGVKSYISGYPDDKPLTQWYSVDRIRISGGLRLFFKNDVVEGMSGSPVLIARPMGSPGCVRACIIAVLSAESRSLPWNVGTRITSQVAADLIFWRNLL